jgi:hypothetical protein
MTGTNGQAGSGWPLSDAARLHDGSPIGVRTGNGSEPTGDDRAEVVLIVKDAQGRR